LELSLENKFVQRMDVREIYEPPSKDDCFLKRPTTMQIRLSTALILFGFLHSFSTVEQLILLASGFLSFEQQLKAFLISGTKSPPIFRRIVSAADTLCRPIPFV